MIPLVQRRTFFFWTTPQTFPFQLHRRHAAGGIMELPSPPPSKDSPALTFALQALLARHEAYMASAERDRAELNARVEQLELDKAALQQDNVKTVEENRALLDQLEALNGTVSESEGKIRSLEAALRSTQLQVKLLEGASARAADMERHIALLETEQQTMQSALIKSEEEARSALYRWRMADRDIKGMQDQLERMEKEAREERERHDEVIERMERQRALEKDLETAAGRLKGAAAVKSITNGKSGTTVVSHFVRDLLQDNANLQLSMAELRELLQNSNDEIQMLREQLLYHQPIDGDVSTVSTLRAELGSPEKTVVEKKISQELHIHHHYHVASKPDVRKPLKKKRLGLASGVLTPPLTSTPSTPVMRPWQLSPSTPAPVVLSDSNNSTPNAVHPPGRWSPSSEEPSELILSSAPSSPQTNPRDSMFDQNPVDLSLPISPSTSIDPMSPSFPSSHGKQLFRGFLTPNKPNPSPPALSTAQASAKVEPRPFLDAVQEELDPTHSKPLVASDAVLEPAHSTQTGLTDDTGHNRPLEDASERNDPSFTSPVSPDVDYFRPDFPTFPRTLRRVASHESIMSLSNGMDIHTLKARPSQLTLRPLGGATATAGIGISTVTALSTLTSTSTEGKRSSAILRDSMGLPMPPMTTREPGRAVSGPLTTNSTRSPNSTGKGGAFGKLTSWRIWRGSSPSTDQPRDAGNAAPSNPLDSASPSTSEEQDGTSIGTNTQSKTPIPKEQDLHRPSGINQSGAVPIPGWHEYWAAHQRRGVPSKVRPDAVDHEALREVLEEV